MDSEVQGERNPHSSDMEEVSCGTQVRYGGYVVFCRHTDQRCFFSAICACKVSFLTLHLLKRGQNVRNLIPNLQLVIVFIYLDVGELRE